MSTFLERLEDESSELFAKILKLNDFIGSEKFSDIDEIQQVLLQVQLKTMEAYLQCLNERLFQLK